MISNVIASYGDTLHKIGVIVQLYYNINRIFLNAIVPKSELTICANKEQTMTSDDLNQTRIVIRAINLITHFYRSNTYT